MLRADFERIYGVQFAELQHKWVELTEGQPLDPKAREVERVDGESCEIRFAEPQWALTPGQSVVLYESRVCLGGGVIR